MVIDARDPSPGTREHFLRVTQLQRWGTIQEYVDLCRMQGYFTPAFYRKATADMERIHVRRMLRQVIDGRGWPILANIVRVDPHGRPERVFMQEELFGPEEYQPSGGLPLPDSTAPPLEGPDLSRPCQGALRRPAATFS